MRIRMSRNFGRAILPATIAATTVLSLVSCSSSGDAPSIGSGSSTSVSAYDAIITAAPVATDAEISGSTWAKKIRSQGFLKSGNIDVLPLFSLKDLNTGELVGFEAGLSEMLAHYVTGKTDVRSLIKSTTVTVDTRESLLQNGSVDAVFATYSITSARAQKVNFAGPYFQSGDAIMVKKGTTGISSVDDLNGKTVATQANSTAALAIKRLAPQAKVLLFKEDAQCVAAVQQGRADAYVLDQGVLIGDAQSNPAVEVIGGNPFTVDPYGIGLSQNTDAKPFVNAFLQKIFDSGDWAKLWKATIGTVVGGDAPTPPKIGSVEGS